METDDATVGRIVSRRTALRWTAGTGVGLAMGGWARSVLGARVPTTQPRQPLVAAPALTEGPFFVDEKLNRSDLIGDTKRASVVDGLPLLLGITIYKLANNECVPLVGATVDLWHADAVGAYSDEDHPMNHENTAGQKWLRGFQVTDDQGQAVFATIFPGWYQGRAPHLHFKVRVPTKDNKTAEFTSQLFFSEADALRIYAQKPYTGRHDTRNSDDGIYNERTASGKRAGDLLLLDLLPHPDGKGHSAIVPIVLTDASFEDAPRGPGGPGGPGRGGPPPGGPGGGPPRDRRRPD